MRGWLGTLPKVEMSMAGLPGVWSPTAHLGQGCWGSPRDVLSVLGHPLAFTSASSDALSSGAQFCWGMSD